MKIFYVLYDAQCSFCLHCRQWLGAQTALLPMEFMPFQSADVEKSFPGLEKWRTADHWLAISDEGGVYQGAKAVIICLYALQNYREWSVRLSGPALLPFASVAVDLLSSPRRNISKWMQRLGDHELARVLEFQASLTPLHSATKAGPVLR